MKRILIAYDGSPQAESALEELSRIGLGSECEALVVSVADVWLPRNVTFGNEPFPENESAHARHARDRAEEMVATAGVLASRAAAQAAQFHPKWRFESYSCGDSPGWAIVAKATEWRANLVVVGSHGRSALERLFLGSVSSKVAAEATCSVRIARPRAGFRSGRLRVVVAVDGSGDSQAAIVEVARRSWPPYCEFRVVAVVDQRMESSMAWTSPGAGDRAQRPGEGSREAVARVVEQDARILYQTGLLVETQVLTGDPKRDLLTIAEAWEADSIFVGARGLHHGGRLALGTTASAVVSRAHCSVEIVRAD